MQFDIIHFEALSSTNQWLKESSEIGSCKPGTVVVADYQVSGRGRLGRSWTSAPGDGLLFSVLFDLPIPESRFPLIGLMLAMGIKDGVDVLLSRMMSPKQVSEVQLGLRWPNDFLAGNRKLAGILCEACSMPDGRRAIVAGIGLNVNQAESDFSQDLRTPATSFYILTGKNHTPSSLLHELLNPIGSLADRVLRDGTDWVAREWAEEAGIIGKRVVVANGAERVEGTVRQVFEDGSLYIEDVTGELKTVRSGDLE